MPRHSSHKQPQEGLTLAPIHLRGRLTEAISLISVPLIGHRSWIKELTSF